MGKRVSSTNDPARLRDVICEIPGYDPYKGADGFDFDAIAAQFAIDFFRECLSFSQGRHAGRPFILETWQEAIVANLFGWYEAATGFRRYRHCLIYVPRKNGKSELAAGLINTVLFCDDEPGAQIYSLASKFEQSHKCVFTPVRRMIEHEPELRRRAEVLAKSIAFGDRVYRCLGSNAAGEHGASTHFALIDELHALQSRELVDAINTSTLARDQPLVVYTTTADYERESICNEIHEYASLIRDGVVDNPRFLPVIYEAKKTDDWEDPAVWRKANPNLGVSISEESFRESVDRAKAIPASVNEFKRLHLNLKTEQAVRLIPMEQWDACATPLRWLAGRPCYGGLDLAATDDMCSFVLVWPSDDGSYDVLPYFWAPRPKAIERQRHEYTPYLSWADRGFLFLTESHSIDYDAVLSWILTCCERFDVQGIAFDPYNSAAIVGELEKNKIEAVATRQGMLSLSPPTKYLLRKLADGAIRHAGHPVLRWNANNVAGIEDTSENLKPVKGKSGDKIDGIMATIFGLSLAMGRKQAAKSVYEDRGVRSV